MPDTEFNLCELCFKADLLGGTCPKCGYNPRTYRHGDASLPPGRAVGRGRYLVGSKRGQGGFGITYVGFDGKSNTRVAVKEHFPSYMATRRPGTTALYPTRGYEGEYAEGLAAFREEGSLLSRFDSHNGIVHVFDCFEENQTAYMIMEYLSGTTLGKLITLRGPIAPEQTVRALVHVMDGLRALHRQGIIHRDVKPDNIFITRAGQIKLIDFGSARHSIAGRSKQLTAIVSEHFAPFEQYRSDGHQGAWTDVYSIGATLYYSLTGRLPHRSPDRIGRPDPLIPPTQINAAIPQPLEQVIQQAMAVEPGSRYQSIDEMTAALRRSYPVAFDTADSRPADVQAAPSAGFTTPPEPISERLRADAGNNVRFAGIAGAGRRIAAYLVDQILLIIALAVALASGVPENLVNIGAPLLLAVYYGAMMSSGRRATLGMSAMEIRIERQDGRTLTFWRGVGRLVAFALLSILFIAPLSIVLSRRRRGLHDRIADTVVVNAVSPVHG